MGTVANIANTNTITSIMAPYPIWGNPPQPTEDEIRGSNDWKNILDPLNLKLRKFILSCGDLCEATYDAFIKEKMNHPESSFFNYVRLQSASDYQVHSFLYSPSSFDGHVDKAEQWIGYVAVTTDEASKRNNRREVYVAWRGTTKLDEWITDIAGAVLQPIGGLLIENDNNQAKVHGGWLDMYTDNKNVPGGKSLRDQLHNAIDELKKEYEGRKEKLSLVITGHSLGAALAILSSFDLVEKNVTGANIPLVSDIVFSCPQVGNEAFKERMRKHTNLKILHIKNVFDVTPLLPGVVFPEYVTTQTAELCVSTGKSPYLENRDLQNFQPKNIMEIIWNIINGLKYMKEMASNQHDLEVLLHLVAWWNGMYMEFEKTPKVERSLALVNKWTRYLKDDLHVPGTWWDDEINKKGMVLEWVPREWPEWASKQPK